MRLSVLIRRGGGRGRGDFVPLLRAVQRRKPDIPELIPPPTPSTLICYHLKSVARTFGGGYYSAHKKIDFENRSHRYARY